MAVIEANVTRATHFDETAPRQGITPTAIMTAIEEMPALYDGASLMFQAVITQTADQPLRGLGVEKIVYDYKPGQMIAFFRLARSAEELKQYFYERKLVHTLLPEHFPDTHLAATAPSLLVVDKVEDHPLTRRQEVLARIRAQDRFQALGIDIDSDNWANFLFDEAGNAVYVDSPTVDVSNPGLESAMQDLPEPRRIRARRFLSRLKQLRAETT